MTAPTQQLPLYPWTDQNRSCPFDPPPQFARLRAEQPVVHVLMKNGHEAWLVTRYEDVRTVLRDARFSANHDRPGFPQMGPVDRAVRPGTFAHMDPPDHFRLRRILAPEFMPKRIDALRPMIQAIVDELIGKVACREHQFDLVESLAMPLPSRVICEMLGVPYADHRFFQDRTRVLMSQATSGMASDSSFEELMVYLDRLVTAKEREPGNDILSRLAEQARQGAITHREAVGMAILLLFAGHETTANMLGLVVLTLLQHADQLGQLRADLALAEPAIEEALRYLTIIHTGIVRIATADVQVGGQVIRAGEGVILALASANRDSAVFGNPDQFDIHRDASQHATFAYGIHLCLGAHLARAELQIAVASLFRRFENLRLAIPLDEVPFRHDMFIYGVHTLPVAW
jgi:cytochrome P450